MLDIARREGLSLLLAMIDIDHFKGINDRYGHATGDHCLQALAAQLNAGFRRRGDLVARVGGEEFAVMAVTNEGATQLERFERFRAAVARASFDTDDDPLAITVSVGAVLRQPGAATEINELLAEADRALYASKNAGRNRVTLG